MYDRALPGGYLDIEPGQEILIPAHAWYRQMRNCSRWLRDMDSTTVIPPTPAKPVTESLPTEYPIVRYDFRGQIVEFGRKTNTRVYYIDDKGKERWCPIEEWEEDAKGIRSNEDF
jgi:hypothetical protein